MPQVVAMALRNEASRSGWPGAGTLGLSKTKKHQNRGNEVRQFSTSATTSGPAAPGCIQSQAYNAAHAAHAHRQPAMNCDRHLRAIGWFRSIACGLRNGVNWTANKRTAMAACTKCRMEGTAAAAGS